MRMPAPTVKMTSSTTNGSIFGGDVESCTKTRAFNNEMRQSALTLGLFSGISGDSASGFISSQNRCAGAPRERHAKAIVLMTAMGRSWWRFEDNGAFYYYNEVTKVRMHARSAIQIRFGKPFANVGDHVGCSRHCRRQHTATTTVTATVVVVAGEVAIVEE
jgi:hypothetical protein